jgi:hypothetical protein
MGNVRDYRWSSIFAWGLTLSGATLATGGVLGMFWPAMDITWLCVAAFAGMMAFGIGLVNCAAAGALQAIKHRKGDGRQVDWTVLVPALLTCAGFAFATNIGVHMGWEIVKANAPDGARLPPTATVDAVFYIFAFAKPAMAWIVEGRKAMDAEVEAARIAQRKKEQAEAAALEMARLSSLSKKRRPEPKEPDVAAPLKRERAKAARAGRQDAAAAAAGSAPNVYGTIPARQTEKALARIQEVVQPPPIEAAQERIRRAFPTATTAEPSKTDASKAA